MIHPSIIALIVKKTVIGKIGALLIGASPFVLAVEMHSHIDALIAAVPPTMAVIVGVLALRKGQAKMFIQMDGRMSQLIESKEKIALSEGKQESRAELLEVSKRASKAEGKEEERSEARQRAEEAPTPVIVENPEDDPANVKAVSDKPPLP